MTSRNNLQRTLMKSLTPKLLHALAFLPVCTYCSLCCNTPSFNKDWCKNPNCLGLGCNSSTCPDISGCICNGRVSYSSKSYCSIVKACLSASNDYKKAQQKVFSLTGMRVDAIPNCGNAILGVICAYQFPRCNDDTTSFETVCLATCQRMYSTCVRPIIPCTPVRNIRIAETCCFGPNAC